MATSTLPTHAPGAQAAIAPAVARFRTGLESCGLATDDMAALLARLAGGATPSDLARELDSGTLLRLRSASRRKHVLAALRRRCLEAQAPLVSSSLLAHFMAKAARPVARSQVLLPYLLGSDRAAYDLASEFVLPRLHPGGALLKADAIAALDALFARYGRKPWSPHLQRTWIEGFLSALRDVGVLGLGARREVVLVYAIRPEVFAFHLWGLWDSGLRGRVLIEHPFWTLLLLRPVEVRPLLDLAVQHGWWRVSLVGDVIEVQPAFGSLAEWIEHGLG